MATLEAKIQTYEKEVGQLNKALEKSDKLIEELNEELDTYRSKPKSDYSSQSRHSTLSGKSSLEDLNLRTSSLSSKRSLEEPLSSQHGLDADLPSKRQLFSDDGEYKSSHRDYLNGEFYSSSDLHDYKGNDKNGAGKNTKRVTFDLPKNETVSFDLEMPSPLKGNRNNSNGRSPSPIKGVLKNGKRSGMSNGDESLSLSKPESLDDSYLDSRRGKTAVTRLEDEDDFYLSKYSRDSKSTKDDNHNYRYTSGRYNADPVQKSESFDLDYPSKSRKSDIYDHVLDDTEAIQSELDDLDISITPDFTDCMKLLNRAEKKVSLGTQPSTYSNSRKDNYKDDEYLDDYRMKDTYRSDPLFSDTKSSDPGRPQSDSKYTSKYYTSSEDYVPRCSALRSEVPSTRYSSSSSAYTDIPTSTLEPSNLPVASGGGYSTIPGSSISTYKPSAIDTMKTTDWDTKTSDYKSSVSDRYTVPGENDKFGVDQYSSSKDSLSHNDRFGVQSDLSSRYSSSSYSSTLNSVPQTSNRMGSSDDISTPTKLSTLRPLSQSGFSRSPSVDNLFMSSKSSTQGSKFATAEDIPTSSYKPRLSLQGFSSSLDSSGKYKPLGERQGMSSLPSSSDTGSGSSRFLASSLPPKPVRTRSQSDIGTSVSALNSASYQRAKGNAPSASLETFTTESTVTAQRPPSYPISSSSYPSEPSSTAHPPPFMENNKYTSSFVPRQDALDAVSTNKFTNSTSIVGARGPVKASYSYTDFDIGVNPRNKSNISDLPLSNRLHTRSNSVDFPLNNKDSESYTTSQRFASYDDQYSSAGASYNIDNRPVHAFDRDLRSYDTNATANYVSASLPNSVSLTGGSTLDDPNKGRYNSSSYMTSSQTSVTSSITFSSSSHLSTASSSSSTSMLPPTSTYPSYQVSKSLDPIRESSAKGNSYLSNTSTTGDISRSDSFLPEPKKRLFDSNDDLDMSLSPIKTTRKTDKY